MKVYYNEIDKYCCQWLAHLMRNGLIPRGDIDDRSITDVRPNDVRDYDQCHFFAGIGGWAESIRLAGWTGRIWTGSCPCQPFSCAGKGEAENDPRHLWPAWFPLIRECNPPVVVGEQVASKAALGWLDGVFADLEGAGYACGAADLCAAGVGAPHIRQRLYWVGHAQGKDRQVSVCQWRPQQGVSESRGASGVGQLANPKVPERWRASGEADGRRWAAETGGSSADGRLGDGIGQGLEGRSVCECGCSCECSPWSASVVIPCRDGKSRRISAQPGDEPLAARLPRSVGPGSTRLERVGLVAAKANRVGRLRGYGNSIVPQVGAVFLRAYMATTSAKEDSK